MSDDKPALAMYEVDVHDQRIVDEIETIAAQTGATRKTVVMMMLAYGLQTYSNGGRITFELRQRAEPAPGADES